MGNPKEADTKVLTPSAARKPPAAGKGRPKGSLNKATKSFRDTVTKLLEANSENVSVWLEKVAKRDPAKALDLITRLAEFAAPKLGRVEHTGEGGGPIKVTRIELVPMGSDDHGKD